METYYDLHKDHLKEYGRKYYAENKQYYKDYYITNKEKMIEYAKANRKQYSQRYLRNYRLSYALRKNEERVKQYRNALENSKD